MNSVDIQDILSNTEEAVLVKLLEKIPLEHAIAAFNVIVPEMKMLRDNLLPEEVTED